MPRRVQPVSDAKREMATDWRLWGRVAAGPPVEAIRGGEIVEAPADLVGGKRFVLQVVGDSMTDAGILDGALVVCEDVTAWAWKRGDYVIAHIDDESLESGTATLKRFRDLGCDQEREERSF